MIGYRAEVICRDGVWRLECQPSWLALEAVGPREVGGIYRCAYWGYEYEVLHIGFGSESRIGWSDWSITVRKADGGVRTHCTGWDARDRVVRRPGE